MRSEKQWKIVAHRTLQVTVRTLALTPSGVGSHWKVLSRGMKWSDLRLIVSLGLLCLRAAVGGRKVERAMIYSTTHLRLQQY